MNNTEHEPILPSISTSSHADGSVFGPEHTEENIIHALSTQSTYKLKHLLELWLSAVVICCAFNKYQKMLLLCDSYKGMSKLKASNRKASNNQYN